MLTTPAQLLRAGIIDLATAFQLGTRECKLAVDLETGAYLVGTNGRGKGGLQRFYLHSGDGKRKLIRAYTVQEAIEEANR